MTPNNNRNRNIIIAVLVVFLVGGTVLLTLATHSKKKPTSTPGNVTTHYDSNSGETVKTISGEHTQTGLPSDFPLFLGINPLVSVGLTTGQVTVMKNAFYQYSQANSLSIKQVSVTADSVKTSMLNAGTENKINVINFTIVFDDKTTVKATVHYSSVANIELYLYDNTTSAQIYDSGLLAAS